MFDEIWGELTLGSDWWLRRWLFPATMGSEEWFWPFFRNPSRYRRSRYCYNRVAPIVWRKS